jgi:hypothetical protein
MLSGAFAESRHTSAIYDVFSRSAVTDPGERGHFQRARFDHPVPKETGWIGNAVDRARADRTTSERTDGCG